MCDHDNREAAMVILRRDETGKPTVWCDPCIAPIVQALNEAGLDTVASCCGHNGKGSDRKGSNIPGRVSLRDGRELLILPNLTTANAILDLIAASPPAVQQEAEVPWTMNHCTRSDFHEPHMWAAGTRECVGFVRPSDALTPDTDGSDQ